MTKAIPRMRPIACSDCTERTLKQFKLSLTEIESHVNKRMLPWYFYRIK